MDGTILFSAGELGGGYDFADSSRIGYTFYSDLGGLSKADLAYIYYGYRF